jgi:hypothetical protein
MEPQPRGPGFGRQPETGPQEVKDIGRLRNDPPAGTKERRCERRTRQAGILQQVQHRLHVLAGHIHVVGAGGLQRQADEFAASLDRRPVEELVLHRGHPPDGMVARARGRNRFPGPNPVPSSHGLTECRPRLRCLPRRAPRRGGASTPSLRTVAGDAGATKPPTPAPGSVRPPDLAAGRDLAIMDPVELSRRPGVRVTVSCRTCSRPNTS